MRLVLDFETYFDKDYSLTKIHTLEYVRDDRFLVHGAAVRIDEEAPRWLQRDTLESFIEELRNESVELICHNTYFDGLILFHHYSYVPTIYRDTLSMARGLLQPLSEYSLDYLCKFLGLGEKIPEVLSLTKGMRTLSAAIAQQLGEYALNDVYLTGKLYDRLVPGMPDDELALIDLTMRWCCRPVLHVDLKRIVSAYKRAAKDRRRKIKASGTTLQVLSSQGKFLEHANNLGIVVPYKLNSKRKQIPALAKNDIGFHQMITEYPEHRALFDGRMAAKSTLEVTRIKRIYKIGKNGTLPMPLKYYGAHTGRWSGSDGLNPQNFTRGSELRKSIIAPPGWVILVADYKSIELCLNVWFCQELLWLDVLLSGQDVYKVSAAQHYEVSYEEINAAQRFFGKTLELGLGYNMGWRKFRTQCALKKIMLSEEKAYQAVSLYRNSHPNIRGKWTELSNKLISMYQEGYSEVQGPITFIHEGILLPNGMRLDYAGLRPSEDGDWYYGLGNKRNKIYGGLMLENIMQALARIVLGEHLLKIHAAGITTVSSTHDEPIMVVREKEIEEAVKTVEQIMVQAPDWASELPLSIEIGWDKCYSK